MGSITRDYLDSLEEQYPTPSSNGEQREKLVLEEGKRYVTRAGRITPPMKRRDSVVKGFRETPYIFTADHNTYTADGKWSLTDPFNEKNLVKEYAPDEQACGSPNGEITLNEALEEVYVRRFSSGAVRSDDRGRIRPDYISPYALEEIAEHFTKAEKDFGSESDSTNYFLGIEPKDVKGSIARHYLDLMKGFAENDEQKIREELRALASNCIMALHQIRIQELGLYKEVYDKTEYVKSDER